MRVAVNITLTDEERAELQRLSRGRSVQARLVLRAKIVLAAATGKENQDIAEELGTLRKTVGLWRKRFAEQRIRQSTCDRAVESGPLRRDFVTALGFRCGASGRDRRGGFG